MDELYKLIRKKKLTSEGKIFEFCEGNKIADVMETAMEAFAITNTKKESPLLGSLFNFSASVALSGGNYPCQSIDCRIKQIKNLARFASIYANCTTIYNPFDFVYYQLNSTGHQELSPEKFRQETLNAFLIVLEFQPLIERDLINFSKTMYVACVNCKKKIENAENVAYANLKNITKDSLFPLMKNEIQIEYEKGSFHLAGIEALIGEDMYMHYKKFPNFLIKNGKRITSMKEMGFNNPLMQKIAGEAINSVMLQKISDPRNLSWTYLTNNMLEKTLLEKMNRHSEGKAVNFFANGLPLIQNRSYESLLKTRESFPDEFNAFQNRVSELIAKANTFETQEEFNLYVENQLKKELDDLKKVQKEDNKKILSGSFAGGAFLGVSILVSLANNSNILPFVAVAKAFYDCLNQTSEAIKMAKKMQESPIYFYYQIERLKE